MPDRSKPPGQRPAQPKPPRQRAKAKPPPVPGRAAKESGVAPAKPAQGPGGDAPRRVSHDAFFKKLLADPQKALAFLRRFLPPGIAERLSDRLPVRLDIQHINGRFKSGQSDLLFRALLQDGGFLDINLEHKSAPAKNVLAQMYSYYIRILGRDPKEAAKALQGDPAVVNLLVYHGARRWNPMVTLEGERADEAARKLADLSLDDFRRYRALFIDLRRHAIEELTDDPELQAALYAMAQDSLEAARLILQRLAVGSQIAQDVLTYIGSNWNTDIRSLEREWRLLNHNRGGIPMGKFYEKLQAEGHERGLAQGHAEGMEQGLAQGREQGLAQGREQGLVQGRAEGMAQGERQGVVKSRADWLLRLLQQRFDSVPQPVQRRLAQASAEDLDAWFHRLPSAQTLEAVFTP